MKNNVKIAGLFAFAVAAGVFACAPARAAERKPNFLFVYTDDQRWDTMGVVQREQGERARFAWFETPNMDRLAAEGVRFRNAFVTLSLCSPSRAAFLTGRYNHLNGVVNNHTPFPKNSVTHASLMRAAGYTTGYIGKWHMGAQRGQRPGFDYLASFIGQGNYIDCPFEINGVKTPTTGWVDDVSTDYAIEFIRQHRDEPFSLVVGFKACHSPRTPPARAAKRFAGSRARRVPNMDVPAIYRNVEKLEAEDASSSPPLESRTPTKPDAKGGPGRRGRGGSNIDLNYFRCISAADDNLGRLLDTLDELGLTDDTVVVFASDNGYYNGEHGLGDKRSAYEESLRIPLVVRYPKRFPRGVVRDELVLNIDLAPTFLDLAGIAVPDEMQGRSWVPLVTGKNPDWRKAFLAEYFFETGYVGTPTLVAVRTERAKLVKYPGAEQWTELFDLAADPYETNNLVGHPAHRELLAQMNEEFDRQVKEVGYVVPAYADKVGEGADVK
jgi:arylsulfatase A-like enzyme